MTADRLPPLASIRAFDALCRLRDFSAAAVELNVTEAAIQHQLRILERHVGKRLVGRASAGSRSSAFALTAAGAEAAIWVTNGFEHFRRGVQKARSDRPIVIGVPVSFAVCWLSRRLQMMQDAFPDQQFEWKSYYGGDPEGRLPGCDLNIVYGSGRAFEEEIALLSHVEAFPVCSPRLLGGSTSARYSDVRSLRLLRDETPDMQRSLPDWRLWFDKRGENPDRFRYGAVASNTFMNIEAARQGQGIAMAFAPLVADDLMDGTLTRLFESSHTVHYSYWVAVAKSAPVDAHAVAHWLLGQASAH